MPRGKSKKALQQEDAKLLKLSKDALDAVKNYNSSSLAMDIVEKYQESGEITFEDVMRKQKDNLTEVINNEIM